MLSSQFIERLVVSVIRAEQDRLVRQGLQTRQTHIDTCLGPLGGCQLSELTVDEDHLGFDSLARLDLVAGVNRVFGLSATGIEDYLLVHRGISDWVHLIGEHFKKMGEGAEMTFSSSGSTGAESHTTHSLAALRSEVSGHLRTSLAGDARPTRVLVSVPLHHIYGFLWGGMIPEALEAEAIDLPAGHAGAIQREARAGDLVISTPFGWAQLAAAGTALRPGVSGVTSGGPTTAETWAAATSLGLARMIEVYGASETGGIGWRTDPEEAFALCSDLTKQDGMLHRPGVEGPLPLQDDLDWPAPGQFEVKGRKDKQVQVGGVNVSLASVRVALLAVQGVQDAAVRLAGDRLKAFIVPKAPSIDETGLEADLRTGLTHLPAPARPVRFAFGPKLPRTATGKLCDWDTS